MCTRAINQGGTADAEHRTLRSAAPLLPCPRSIRHCCRRRLTTTNCAYCKASTRRFFNHTTDWFVATYSLPCIVRLPTDAATISLPFTRMRTLLVTSRRCAAIRSGAERSPLRCEVDEGEQRIQSAIPDHPHPTTPRPHTRVTSSHKRSTRFVSAQPRSVAPVPTPAVTALLPATCAPTSSAQPG